jgi:hypothetical protein
MNIYILLLGGLSIPLLISSFILDYLDHTNKRKTLWGYKAVGIRRYLTLASLLLGVASVLLEINDKIDTNVEAINRQTELLNNLAKIINNTDPITGSTLQVNWECADTASYHHLKEHLQRREIIKTSHLRYNQYTDSNAAIWPLEDVNLYFLDSGSYSQYKNQLFVHTDYDDEKSSSLIKYVKLQLAAENRSAILTAKDIFERRENGVDDRDTNYIHGSSLLKMRSRVINQTLGFSNLSDLYCVMTVEQLSSKERVNVFRVDSLHNWNNTKTIYVHFEEKAIFRQGKFQVFVCKKPVLINN